METGPYPNKKGVEYRRGAVIYYAERGVGSVIYYAERGHLALLVTVLDHYTFKVMHYCTAKFTTSAKDKKIYSSTIFYCFS